MSRDPGLFLADIEETCQRILTYTRDLDRRRFEQDTRTVDAVLRNLEVIGEAVKRLPPELVRNEASIEWRRIAGLRDMLAHATSGSTWTSSGTWSSTRSSRSGSALPR